MLNPQESCLEKIPMHVKTKGTESVVQYILDIFRSGNPKALYRTKIMLVGQTGCGKTTLIDNLFALTGKLKKERSFILSNKEHVFSLQGRTLKQVPDETNPNGEEIFLNEDSKVSVSEEGLTISLPMEQRGFKIQDEKTKTAWYQRIKRAIRNESTHGVEITKKTMTHPIIDDFIKRNEEGKSFKEMGKFELSIWDFGGQEKYYNSYQRFISGKGIYLVVWKLSDEEEKGLQNLDFWLQSLKARLPTPNCVVPKDYSIIIVGSHLDQADRSSLQDKKRKVESLLDKVGFNFPITQVNVSCHREKENIDNLMELILSNLLNHSYFGQATAETFFFMEKVIQETKEGIIMERKRKEDSNLPIISPYSLSISSER